jgi:23S rRNA-/tRNA-specific pseudouridylate synthase
VLLIEARPKTGRTHQIRAHLAEAGAPIFGDERYGASMALSGCQVARTMLHASRLALQHPVTGARLVIECSYPRDFRHALESLRRASSSPAGQRRS